MWASFFLIWFLLWAFYVLSIKAQMSSEFSFFFFTIRRVWPWLFTSHHLRQCLCNGLSYRHLNTLIHSFTSYKSLIPLSRIKSTIASSNVTEASLINVLLLRMNIPTETKSKDFTLSSIKSINGKFICSSSRQFESWTQFTAEVRLLIFLVSTCSSLTSR